MRTVLSRVNDAVKMLGFKVSITIVLSLFFVELFFINILLPWIFLVFVIYLWVLHRHAEVGLFIALVIILNCFSLISENLFRLPNIFRLRDVFLILTFIPLLEGVARRDSRIKYIFSGPFAKCIYVMLLLFILQVLITKYRFSGETLSSIVRAGRKYVYYAIFFPLVYVLIEDDRFKRFLKLLCGSAIVFSCLYILQFALGQSHQIFKWAVVVEQNLQSYYVTRMYIDGQTVATLIFHVSFMVYLFCQQFRYKIQNTFLLLLTGAETLVTFGRAHLFGVITGILFGLFLARKIKRRGLVKLFLLALAIAVVNFLAVGIFKPKLQFFQAIATRITSIYGAVVERNDTFGFRFEDSWGRLELIKDNPVFGVGFVHDESRLFSLMRGYGGALRSADSGIVTLMLDFGIIGMIWLFILSVVFWKRGMKCFRASTSMLNKAVVLGVISFYFGRLFSCITLVDFIVYDGIVVISIALALLEIINYRIYGAVDAKD